MYKNMFYNVLEVWDLFEDGNYCVNNNTIFIIKMARFYIKKKKKLWR